MRLRLSSNPDGWDAPALEEVERIANDELVLFLYESALKRRASPPGKAVRRRDELRAHIEAKVDRVRDPQ